MATPGSGWAIVGLGNPGSRYADTRHNVGFWAVESIKNTFAPDVKITSKYECEFSRLALPNGQTILLVKPLGYMNLSGQTVQPLLNFFKVAPSQVIAIHDDVDLESGALKAKLGGSSAGHHGLDSLEVYLGTRDFYRIRIGISRGPSLQRDVKSWVLSVPVGEEMERLRETALDAGKMAYEIVQSGLQKACQKYSRGAFTK